MSSRKKICQRLGIVGATGMVGKSFLSLLESQGFQFEDLRLFASESSEGQVRTYQGKNWPVVTLKPKCFEGLDLVFFSSGDDISAAWAPQATEQGAWVVDNSAAFRMADFPLIVPEVNGDLLSSMQKPLIIANPNCSTIQLVVALKPILDRFGIEEVIVSSYQAVSGGGQKAQDELMSQVQTMSASGFQSREGLKKEVFPHEIAFNCIPQVGSFNDKGFCSEEMKIMLETRKILRVPDLKISAFTVRVPVLNGHAESVWVTLPKQVADSEMISALQDFPGLRLLQGDREGNYPTPAFASGKEGVFVGRVHRDFANPRRWLMWVVADNILKGAALNGLQIAQAIFDFEKRP